MTRFSDIELKCPCCRRRFSSRCLLSTNTAGSLSTDFHQRAGGSQPLVFLIHACPNCGYSGYQTDFGRKRIKRKIRKLIWERSGTLVEKDYTWPEKKYESTAIIARWMDKPDKHVGDLYLKAAWCSSDGEKKFEEKQYRIKAIECFEGALEKKEMPEKDRPTHYYLVAENYRRVDEPEKADIWYENAIDALAEYPDQDWLLELAIQQKNNPKEFIRE